MGTAFHNQKNGNLFPDNLLKKFPKRGLWLLILLLIFIVLLSICFLTFIEQASAQSIAHHIKDVWLRIEQTHISWNAHQDILSDIDLHQNEQLVQHSKNISHCSLEEPLISVVALDVSAVS